jgi:prepilin-type N-terminal cleavage/methylation domain-containing protein
MRRRQGFTLVEMLVAMTLVIFIMVILTQAFTTGMDAFRQLKTIGDMSEKLRTAGNFLKRDLAADHFEGKRRLSDPNFWTVGPPTEGFLRVWQGIDSATTTPPTFIDDDGIPAPYSFTHYLHFTVKRRGNRRDEFASASVPATMPAAQRTQLISSGRPDSRFQDALNTYSSQWYEVTYFLRETGELTTGTPGVKRYTLYRRQRLAVLDNTALTALNFTSPVPLANQNDLATYGELSCHKNNPNPIVYPDTLIFNNPNDLTNPLVRFGADTTTPNGIPQDTVGGIRTYPVLDQASGMAGADILLTDVVSMTVQVMLPGTTDFQDLPAALADASGQRVFDTSNTAASASVPSIKAIRITLRIWDIKTELTRQITIVQEM